MYTTLIEDFVDDARSVTGEAFESGSTDVAAENDTGDILPDIADADSEEQDASAGDLVDESLDVESWSDDPVRM